ncbi:MAG: hypothetical protein LBH44_00210 [Treponema sp.]|nr:hypothetical protein [Treponema sp.]
MSLPLTRKSTDRSGTEQFAFSFFCDRCGKEWRSETLPFNYGYFTAIENDIARQFLWAHEHKAAFEQANLDARFQYNLCPVCGKRVCNDCLCNRDVCKDCN